MENAVDSITLAIGAWVARHIQDDKPWQVFQLDYFSYIGYKIVTQVELHQKLEVLHAVKSRNLVVFKTELGQTAQII